MLKPSLFLLSLASIWTYPHHAAAVTIYGQEGVTAVSGAATGTGAAAAATATDWLSALAAFNNVTLTAPALPTSMPSTAFTIPVMNNAQDVQGLSIQQGADFFGFSIEMSVVTQVIGKNASFIQVPFLNLLATVADRAGRVRIRVGGNTQETATLVDSLPDNEMIAKDKTDATNPVRCFSCLSELFFGPRRSLWIHGCVLRRFGCSVCTCSSRPASGCVLPWKLYSQIISRSFSRLGKTIPMVYA
ncbi:hypothetical protein BD309DRAFT_409143 [Dichomitus squalens]|nr:hypothetical protein BD309DRAFT_409143 [Dichomitus squalens]